MEVGDHTWGWALLADARPSPTPRPPQHGLAAAGWCGACGAVGGGLGGVLARQGGGPGWWGDVIRAAGDARGCWWSMSGSCGRQGDDGCGPGSRFRLSAGCPWHPPPYWSFAVGVRRRGSWLVSRWGVLGPGEIPGLSTTVAATSRRCPGAVYLLGGAAEVPSPPSPTFGPGESSNPSDWTAVALRELFPSWRRYLGPCGSRRGWPCCKVLASCSVAAPKLSLLCFGLPWLKLLAALMCSSLGGALCGPSWCGTVLIM
jgi:hypothetical protein